MKLRARNCKHGFNPVDGPGLWCPACDKEDADRAMARVGVPRWRRVLAWFGWF